MAYFEHPRLHCCKLRFHRNISATIYFELLIYSSSSTGPGRFTPITTLFTSDSVTFPLASLFRFLFYPSVNWHYYALLDEYFQITLRVRNSNTVHRLVSNLLMKIECWETHIYIKTECLQIKLKGIEIVLTITNFSLSRLQRCTPTTSPSSCCTCKAPRITTTSITRTILSAEAWS